MNRPRGRPPRDKAGVSPDDILLAALDLLDAKGAEAFTMRALAERLQVNAMTIYHHFGDRDGSIAASARQPLAPPVIASRRFCWPIMRRFCTNPASPCSSSAGQRSFPEQARRITEDIAALLGEAGLSPQRSRLWVNILVDFTRGAAVATAMGGQSTFDAPGADKGYDDALAELLNALAD